MNRWLSVLSLVVLLLVTWGNSAVAQVSLSSITGRVEDASGAEVPGTMITVTNLETGVARTVTAEGDGSYRVLSLPVGRYEVKAEKAGFKAQIQSGINLAVGQQAVVNLKLEVGQVQQEVTVTGEASLVNTTTESVSGLVNEKTVKDLPLNGRSFDQLLALNAGAANITTVIRGTQVGTGGAGAQVGNYFTVSGRGWGENLFLLNGVEYPGPSDLHSEPGGVSGQLLGVDAVREFNVETDTYGAQYGKRAGGQISIVTMSGTNQLHGNVFEFLRNSALDARNYFDRPLNSVTGAPERIPPFKRNQFGGSLGGPIQRDKTFIFGNYEGFRQRLGVSNVSVVPDANARLGILPCGIITPLPSGCKSATDTTLMKVPNAQAGMLAIMAAYYAAPNGPAQGSGLAQAFYNPPQSIREDFGTVRVDHTYSNQKDTLGGSYLIDDGQSKTPIVDPLFAQTIFVRSHVLSLQETHIFSPNLINTATFGFSRSTFHFLSGPYNPISPSLYFLQGPEPGQIRISSPGGITAGGGLTSTDQYTARSLFTYQDAVQLIKGRHQFSFGGIISPLGTNELAPVAQGGSTTFATLSQFIQGQVQLFNVTPLTTRMHWRQFEGAWYAQDTIQVRRNLTVRLGLRHEFTNGWHEANNNFYNFEIGSNGVFLTTPVGPLGSLYTENNSKWLFGPRVGIAWDVFGNGKTSVRSGFGTYYNLVDNPGKSFLDRTPPLNGQVAFANQAFLPLIPFNPNAPLPPSCGPGAPAVCTTYAPLGVQPALKTPTVEEWNLTLEQQILPNTSLRVGYVGSHGYHGSVATDPNQVQSQICASATCTAGGISGSTSIVTQGTIYVPVPSGTLTGSKLPNPFLSTGSYLASVSNSSYNGLNVEATHRMSAGLQFKAAYTWSKDLDLSSDNTNIDLLIDTAHPQLSKGQSTENLPQKFVFSGGYELPFGHNKPWLNGLTGVGGKLVSGWQINTIVSASSGIPFSIIQGTNRSGNGETSGGPPSYNPAFKGPIITGDPTRWFDPNAFIEPAFGTFGNVQQHAFRGPSNRNFDFSIFKTTAVTERINVQFRAEAFNILNHTNFSQPGNTSGGNSVSPFSSTAGNGTPNLTAGNIAAAATARQLQFGLKVIF